MQDLVMLNPLGSRERLRMDTAEKPSSPTQDNRPEPFDVVLIRRKRLQQVIDEQYGGKQSSLVEAIEVNAGELSGLLRSKAFGEKKARGLEVSLGLPRGYLDGQAGDIHDTMKRLYQAAAELKCRHGQSEVARFLNLSPQVLANWESRGMSKGGILTAQKTTGCSAVWLETGKGEMRLSEAAALSLLNDHAELLEAWGYLLPAEKATIMEQIRHMAAHNKAVLEHYKDKP